MSDTQKVFVALPGGWPQCVLGASTGPLLKALPPTFKLPSTNLKAIITYYWSYNLLKSYYVPGTVLGIAEALLVAFSL